MPLDDIDDALGQLFWVSRNEFFGLRFNCEVQNACRYLRLSDAIGELPLDCDGLEITRSFAEYERRVNRADRNGSNARCRNPVKEGNPRARPHYLSVGINQD